MRVIVRREGLRWRGKLHPDISRGTPLFVDGLEVGAVRYGETVEINGPDRPAFLRVGRRWNKPSQTVLLDPAASVHGFSVVLHKWPTMLGVFLGLLAMVATAFLALEAAQVLGAWTSLLVGALPTGIIVALLAFSSMRARFGRSLGEALLASAASFSIQAYLLFRPAAEGALLYLSVGLYVTALLGVLISVLYAWPGAVLRLVREAPEDLTHTGKGLG